MRGLVIVFTDDHEPEHVFGDGQARINLVGADGAPVLLWVEGMKANDVWSGRCSWSGTISRCFSIDGGKSVADLTDADIDASVERGRIARQSEPRAASVRYDRKNSRIVIDLTNGCVFAFPPHLAQGLEQATDEDLAGVEVLGAGYGLHWEALEVDLSVPGLLAGLFGTRAYMARKAGQATSPAKAAAARANGAKGGRPRKRSAS